MSIQKKMWQVKMYTKPLKFTQNASGFVKTNDFVQIVEISTKLWNLSKIYENLWMEEHERAWF